LIELEEYRHLELLYRGLTTMDNVTAMERLIEMIQKYPSNSDLLESFKDVKVT
jgi:transcription termination factor Rho